jgi:AcrR family transcriptional regulator
LKAQIVLASSIHGSPVRFIDTQAGPYRLTLALYSDSLQAGDVIPFALAIAPGTHRPLTYQVTASPGPGVPASLAQGDVNPLQSTPYGVPGSITLITRGPWTLHIVISGPAGRGEASISLTAVTFPAIPAWLAWNIGLLPVYGLLLFWMEQSRRTAQKPVNDPAKPSVPATMKEVFLMARPADPHRRETILRAATEVFAEQGFSDARLADIAQRAGVVTSTLYLYFRSKEEMVSAIAKENRQILLDKWEPVLSHLRGEENIAQFVEIVLAHAKVHRDQIIVIDLESGLSTPRRGRRRAGRGPRIEKGIEIIRHLMAEGALSPYDPALVMEMLILMTRWIISQSLALTEQEGEPFKQFCVQWLSQALLPVRGGAAHP